MGTYVEALNRIKEQRTMAPEGCRAKMPWKCDCLGDAQRFAYEVIVNDDMRASKALLEGMTAWSFNLLVEIKPQFTNCVRDSQEEAMLER